MILEVAVHTMDGAYQAQKGGADRIELSANPTEGGMTPSYGTIELVRQHMNLDVSVMIRPRSGDFVYSIEEYHIMKKDIEICKRLSVDGVVFGILNNDATLNKSQCKKLVDLARPLKVTCHRAFDMAADPFQALEDCIEIGFDRILTSGQQKSANEGVELIAELVKRAGERIVIVSAGGVTEINVNHIVSVSGVREIHFSTPLFKESNMRILNPQVDFATAIHDDLRRATVDSESIKRMRSLIASN